MWVYYVVMVIIALVAILFTPKMKSQNVDAETIEVTKASEGAIIPVLFGTRDIKSQLVAWYGDINAEAIRSKGGKK